MRKLVWAVCAAMMMSVPGLAQQTQWNPDQAAEEAQKPEHPITAAQVHEMMQLMGMANLQKQMLQGFMPAMRQMMPPYVPADVMDDFQKSLLGAKMDAIVVKAYQEHISTDDAALVIAFYKTPAGRRMIASTPAIMKETQQAGAQLGQQLMMQVIDRHKAEIEDAGKKYQQEHPGTTPQQ